MRPAHYEDIPADKIPKLSLDHGGEAILIAGQCQLDNQIAQGYINGLDGQHLSTDPIYIDLRLKAGQTSKIALPAAHNAFVYVYEGEAIIGEQIIASTTSALLSQGDELLITASGDTRLLLLAASPIGETVVQYGPFVMNSSDEIEQAMRDYRDGVLTSG